MTMKRWNGTAAVDLVTAKRWDGTAFVPLTLAKRWDGTAFVAMTLPGGGGGAFGVVGAPNPTTTNTIAEDELATLVTSHPATVTASGGTAPYTYAWTYVSGSPAILCNSPTAATTTFEATIYRGTTRSAVWRCTVTDAAAASAYVDITVTLTRPAAPPL